MILWHVGAALLLTYVTLGRRRIDYRFVLLGALLPDALDPVLGALVFGGGNDRYAAHSLTAAIVVAIVVIALFSGTARLALFGIAVGWVTHLVADGMWEAPLTFLWPAFGVTEFDAAGEPYSWDLFANPGDHLTTWAAEIVGAGAIAWFAIAFGWKDRERFKTFLRDGYLRP